MQVSFLLNIILRIDALQNEIWFLWFFDGYHVQGCSVHHCYCSGERGHTNFTVEFREIVSHHNIVEFLFNLTVNPCSKTAHMNELTGTFTSTGVNQWFFLGGFLAKANFAATDQRFLDFMVSRADIKVGSLFVGVDLLLVSDF